MRGYKVVSATLLSSWAGEDFMVKYIRDQWVEAPEGALELGYGLCYYELLRYTVTTPGQRIFICEAEDKMPLPPYRVKFQFYLSTPHNLKRSLEVLKEWPLEPHPDFSQFWPEGTQMARRIKLLEEFKRR